MYILPEDSKTTGAAIGQEGKDEGEADGGETLTEDGAGQAGSSNE